MSDDFSDNTQATFDALLAESNTELSKKYDMPEVPGTTSRQLSYGWAQGQNIVGNVVGVAKSATKAASGPSDFDFYAKFNEKLRQADISEEFPEYKGLKPEDRTGAMVAGEVAVAVADPVLAVLPWTRLGKAAYQAGSLATAGLYGSVAGLEDSARQLNTDGSVDPLRTGLVTLAGGTIAGGLDKVVRSFPAIKETFKQRIAQNEEQAEFIDDMARVVEEGKPRVRVDVEGSPIKDRVRVDVTGKPIGEDKARVKVDVEGNPIQAFTPEEEQVVSKTTKATPKLDKVTFEDLDFQERLVQISRIDKAIEKTRAKLASKSKKYNKEKLNQTLEKQLNYKARLEENISEDMIKLYKDKADVTVDLLEDLADQGELTESIFSKVLMEFTRPAIGGTGGAIVGNMFDDDSDHNFMYWGAALGAGGMFLQKRIQNSEALTSLKDNGDVIINQGLKATASRMMSQLKYQTATTAATKMDAAGGWVQLIGNKLFSRIASGDVNSVEALTIQKQDEYFARLAEAVESPTLKSVVERLQTMTEGTRVKIQDEIFAINTVAGEVLRGLTDINNLSVGYKGLTGKLNPLSAEDIEAVKNAVPKLAALRDEHKQYVQAAGVSLKQDLGDDYGLPQLWNRELIGKNYQSFLVDLKKAVEIQKNNKGKSFNTNNFAEKVSGREYLRDDYGKSDAVFVTSEYSKHKIFRSTSNYFETARQLTDKEAVRFLVSKGWINLDANEALAKYGFESTKIAEFARIFGANGEVINLALNRLTKGFNAAADEAPLEQRDLILKEGEAQIKLITDGVEAFWGKLGTPKPVASNSVRTLQALANMQYLGTVAIANLPDLLQPFINSGFGEAAKVTLNRFSKGPSFAQEGTFKYSNTWERELQNFLIGGGIDSRSSAFIVNSQDLFFKGVGLQKVTEASRNFAYDVGVNRAFNLASKTKLSSVERKELQTLLGKEVTPEDLQVIKQYKTAEEAFKSLDARNFLDTAGRQAADRDAIIPLVGNRLLFTQSRNPYVRATGQFLSWTMAKSAQLNKIISKIEDGDARLALRMLAAVPVYAGLREFKGMVNPNTSVDAYEDEDFIDKGLRGLKISGQANNWAVDKISEILKYNLSSRDNQLGGIAPALGFLEQALKTFIIDVPKDLVQGDVSEAATKAGEVLPFSSQIIAGTEKVKEAFSTGGEVEVPNAPPEPDERIDKMTGLPYNFQAGPAFMDEEDPLKRLGLAGGGVLTQQDSLQRMGFGLGSLVSRGVTKLLGETVDVFDTPSAKTLAQATPEGSVDDVAKSLEKVPSKNLNKEVSPDQYIKERASLDEAETPKEWKAKAKQLVKDTREIDPVVRTPELEKSAQDFQANLITRGEHLENIDLYKPVTPFKQLTAEPSDKALVFSLDDKQIKQGFFVLDSQTVEKFNVAKSPLSIGDFFRGRLDIPAYNSYDTWIVAGKAKGLDGTHYAKAMHYVGKEGEPVTFTASQKAEKILTGQANKDTIAFINGFIKDLDPVAIRKKADELLRDPEWTQVGFDPRRQTKFYVREGDMVGTPVKEAEEVIQIGPLVLAKNVVMDTKYTGLAVGGLA